MNIYNIIIATEMLLANIYVTYICSKKRYSFWKNLGIFFLSYLFFIALFWAIRTVLPPVPEGSGMLLFTGFLFIIPLFLVYDQDIRYTLVIMCLSWLYTTTLFSLSLIIAQLIDNTMLLLLGSIIQSVLLLATYPLFVGYVRNKFHYIMMKMDCNTLHLLIILTLLGFFIISFHHIHLFTGHNDILSLTIVVLFSLFIVLLYRLFYILASSKKKVVYLRNLISKDWLNNLKNQNELVQDLAYFDKFQELKTIIDINVQLDSSKKFSELHEVTTIGQYMQIVSGILPLSTTLYRIENHHFVVLSNPKETQSILYDIKSLRLPDFDSIQTQIIVYSYPSDKKQVHYLLKTNESN